MTNVTSDTQESARTQTLVREALTKGFEPLARGECRNFTLAREGTNLTCATCGNRIFEISRSQWLRFIEIVWPDKKKVGILLAESVRTSSQNWPPPPAGILFRMLTEMGRKIERAQKANECAEAFFEVLKYLSCPEPGWGGVEFKVIP